MERSDCPDCGTRVGEQHRLGCDVERCVLCGRQAITCDCVYTLNGIDPNTLEETHPVIYENGATDGMWEKYDAEVDKYGGRMIWTGEWPGVAECREFGWYSKFVPGQGWVKCEKDDPQLDPQCAEDLNRLHEPECQWDRTQKRWVLQKED